MESSTSTAILKQCIMDDALFAFIDRAYSRSFKYGYVFELL